MNNEVILELKDISFIVRKNGVSHEILKSLNLKIFKSEIFGLTGESGSGKTTTGSIISGLELQTNGKKYFNGKEFSGIDSNHRIQFLFQNYSATFDPKQKIESSFQEFIKLKNYRNDEGFRLKKELLDMVGLSEQLLDRFPSQLSGGQLQRLALARLLILKPSLLILDEPFASQDVVSTVNLIKILKRINEEQNITIICISHDLHILLRFCDRIGIMKDGELFEIINLDRFNGSFDFPQTNYGILLFKSFGIMR